MEKKESSLIPADPTEGMILSNGLTVRTLYNKSWQLIECFLEKEGVLQGQNLLYYPDRRIKQENYYVDGLLQGPSLFYSSTGLILAQSHYVQGKLHGECLWYYPSGTLYSRQNFFEGKWQGTQSFYYEEGMEKTILHYDKGQLLEPATLLEPSGAPTQREMRWKPTKV